MKEKCDLILSCYHSIQGKLRWRDKGICQFDTLDFLILFVTISPLTVSSSDTLNEHLKKLLTFLIKERVDEKKREREGESQGGKRIRVYQCIRSVSNFTCEIVISITKHVF